MHKKVREVASVKPSPTTQMQVQTRAPPDLRKTALLLLAEEIDHDGEASEAWVTYPEAQVLHMTPKYPAPHSARVPFTPLRQAPDSRHL